MPQIQPKSLTRLDTQEPRMTRGKLCPRCQTVYNEDAEEGNFCARDGVALLSSDRIFAGKYLLGEQLGFGQTGDVYTATQSGVGRQVALKILRADHLDNPDVVKRFEREAQIASSIDHPNAVTIFESGRAADGQAYIAMELLEGETLERRLQREGPLPVPRALELLIPVLRAVAAAHGRGVVHRDLKPDNIFIARKHSEEGSEQVVKVLDFGIAGRVTSVTRPSAPDARLGTPLYMAPEQLQGAEATLRSDVFALGVIFTEVLTGRLPWGETAATISATSTMARVVRSPSRLAELLPGTQFPEALQALVSQMLARDPQQRQVDAATVLRQLQPIVIAVSPALQMEMLSARMLAVGPGALAPFIDSTSTLTGRETQPLATIPVRKRWLGAAGALLLLGAVALLWHRQPAHLLGRKLEGLRAARVAPLPALFLPSRSDIGQRAGSEVEPPPAGFTAPVPTLAENAPASPVISGEPHRRHHRSERASAAELYPARPGRHSHRSRTTARSDSPAVR